MDLITPKQLVTANRYLEYFGGETLARILFKLLKLDRINREYARLSFLPAKEFLTQVIERLQVGY